MTLTRILEAEVMDTPEDALEYDTMDFDVAHARLRDTCARLGIVWLEREVWLWPGAHEPAVRFIGTTLWSDFDALDAAPGAPDTALTQQLRARDKAFRAANYYLKKTGTSRHGQAMLAEAVREQALLCQDWLARARLWLHGHLHAPSDYVKNGCRVVANPLGYARKNEQSAFQPASCIEL